MLKNNKVLCCIFEVGQTLLDASTNETESLEGYGYIIYKTLFANDYLFYLP